MGRKRINTTLPNLQYGHLTTKRLYGYKEDGQELWECDCKCGGNTITTAYNLIRGHTTSCGCLKNNGNCNHKHGMSKDRIYNIYIKMKQRCFNKNDKSYLNYGGRGITICKEWLGENGFINFYEWSKNNGYSDELTIDRIDTNGNYEPGNCRWTNYKVQQNNRTNNRIVEYKGNQYTLSELSDKCNIPYERLRTRLLAGWSVIEAVKTSKQ